MTWVPSPRPRNPNNHDISPNVNLPNEKLTFESNLEIRLDPAAARERSCSAHLGRALLIFGRGGQVWELGRSRVAAAMGGPTEEPGAWLRECFLLRSSRSACLQVWFELDPAPAAPLLPLVIAAHTNLLRHIYLTRLRDVVLCVGSAHAAPLPRQHAPVGCFHEKSPVKRDMGF